MSSAFSKKFRFSSVHTYTEQNSPISDKKNWVPKSKFGYVKTALNVKIQYQSLHLRRKKMKILSKTNVTQTAIKSLL